LSHPSGRAGRTAAAAILACACSAVFIPAAAHVAAASPVSIRLSAPASAHVGDVVPVTVSTDRAVTVAAFEVAASVDPSAAEVEGADSSASTATQPMSFVENAGSVLAAYTPAGRANAPTTTLGVFYVRVEQAGRVEVRTDSVVLADADGSRIAATGAPASATVTVLDTDGSTSSRLFAAPAARWNLTDSSAGVGGFKTLADAEVLFQTSRLADAPCSGSDAASAGGCIDIADVQRMATTASPAGKAPTVAALNPNITYTVTSASDSGGSCPGASCTLRAAITAANGDGAINTIDFNIPGGGVHTIQLNSQLPDITEGQLTIDGYTQPGATANTNAAPGPDNAHLMIQIAAAGANAYDTFVVKSAGNTFKGLAIYNTRRPFWVDGSGASGNVIQGNFIGTNAAGTWTTAADDANGHGVHIQQDATNTQVGGTDPADRNVISGNARSGVGIWDTGSDGTLIYGNIIGLNPSGTAALPNRKHGVDFNFGASGSRLGGMAAGQINVISGNTNPNPADVGSGVEISHQPGTTDNRVIGNWIGTDLTGNAAPAYAANADAGVYIEDGASANTVSNNTIVNNTRGGVRVLPHNDPNNPISTGNVISHNLIGVTNNGTPAGNGQLGVAVDGDQTIIDSNTIAYNGGAGILSGLLNQQGHNTFTKNIIHDNLSTSLSIDLLAADAKRGVTLNDPGDADTGANTLLNFPVIATATTTGTSGTACPGCTVELFLTGTPTAANGVGPARAYVTSTVANGQGVFTVSYAAVPLSGAMTATATDSQGDTSELSENVALTQGSGGPPPPPPPPPPPGTNFVTMTPARLLETRSGDPAFVTVDGLFQGIGARGFGTVTELQVTGRAGVPADASAVALNITASGAPIAGFVTVFPCGSPQPLASNLNYVSGSTIPNLVISKIGTGGTVCIFNSSPVDLIADLNGYFPAAATYQTMVPARLLETRTGDPAFQTVDGQSQGIGLRPIGTVTELQITGRDGVPGNASAVALNVTATGATIPGFVTVFPCGSPQPLASNLNYVGGSTIPNLVIAKIGTAGKVCLFNSSPVHLVADINGYFPASTTYVTMSPQRVLETRTGDPAFATVDGQFQGIGLRPIGTVTELQITGRAGVPVGASSVVLNVTATGATIAGFVTVFPCGVDQPLASNLNYVAGSTIPNLVIAQVGLGGKVCLFNSSPVHLVADVNGYFPTA
jgi:CSLREA domain-containing protein